MAYLRANVSSGIDRDEPDDVATIIRESGDAQVEFEADGSSGLSVQSPSSAAMRRQSRTANLQLLLGMMALVASTTFAVKRQFIDKPRRRLALAGLRRPSALDDPSQQLALVAELRRRQRLKKGIDYEDEPPVEDGDEFYGGGDGGEGTPQQRRQPVRNEANNAFGQVGPASAISAASANSLPAHLFTPLPLSGSKGSNFSASAHAHALFNVSDPLAEHAQQPPSGGASAEDAARLLERLRGDPAALGLNASHPQMELINGTWVSAPVWFKCPPWNGTAEQRKAKCSGVGGGPLGSKRDPNGYVHLISAREGMSAWTHVIWEMLRFAKMLNRTFVEPCVAGGEIIPCTPGRVHMVPESVRKAGRPGAISAKKDPLRVKAFLGACGTNGRGRGIEKRAGRSYPLRLYLDLRALRQYWKKIISFEEWAQLELCDCAEDELGWDGRHVSAELGYCVAWGPRAAQIRSSWCSPDQGPYRFASVWAPRIMPETMPHWVRNGRFQGHMFYYLPELKADPRRNMFFWNVWRGSFEPLGSHKKAPKFNEIHQAAIDAWLKDRLGLAASQYAAFQWRSEQVPEANIYPCSVELARISRPVIDAIRGPELNAGVLIADMPSPNNPCMMWKEYHASNRNVSEHRRAVKKLTSVGMVKYDKDHPGLDAGVLSIRDWLLATQATYYVTCAGTNDKCKSCFRAESKFIHRIVEARRQAKMSSFTRWFELTPKALFSLAAGPPKPYNVTPPLVTLANAGSGATAVAAAAGVPVDPSQVNAQGASVGGATAGGAGHGAGKGSVSGFSFNKPVM